MLNTESKQSLENIYSLNKYILSLGESFFTTPKIIVVNNPRHREKEISITNIQNLSKELNYPYLIVNACCKQSTESFLNELLKLLDLKGIINQFTEVSDEFKILEITEQGEDRKECDHTDTMDIADDGLKSTFNGTTLLPNDAKYTLPQTSNNTNRPSNNKSKLTKQKNGKEDNSEILKYTNNNTITKQIENEKYMNSFKTTKSNKLPKNSGKINKSEGGCTGKCCECIIF